MVNALFFLFACLLCLVNAQRLDESRLVCKNRTVIISTGNLIPSDPILLNFRGQQLKKDFDEIVHEECSKLENSHSLPTRAKRSWKAVVKALPKLGKEVAKHNSKNWFKKAKTGLKNLSKAKSPLKKLYRGAKNSVKIGAGVFSTVAKFPEFISNIRNADEILKDETERYYSQFNSPRLIDTVHRFIKDTSPETQLVQFRRSVTNLLNNATLDEFILGKARNSLEKSIDMEKIEGTVSDVRCVQDDFRKIFSIQLRILVAEEMETEARKCEDVGQQKDQTEYRFHRLPSEYLVENGGNWFQLNGAQCTSTNDGSMLDCRNSDLEEVDCSPDNLVDCEQRTIHLIEGKSYFRKLLKGAVYYGPSNTLKTVTRERINNRSREDQQSIEPFDLRYFRPLPGMDDFDENSFIVK